MSAVLTLNFDNVLCTRVICSSSDWAHENVELKVEAAANAVRHPSHSQEPDIRRACAVIDIISLAVAACVSLS